MARAPERPPPRSASSCTRWRGDGALLHPVPRPGRGHTLETDIDRLLVHPGEDGAAASRELAAYAGCYFDGRARFRVLVQGGTLAVELPQQEMLRLKPPDGEGRRVAEFDERQALSFVQDDAGAVLAMRSHQDFQVVDLPRGERAVQKYLGSCHDPGSNVDVELLIQNGHLAVKSPLVPAVLEFITPADGKEWRLRLYPATSITFQEDEQGRVLSSTAHIPGKGAFVRPRVGGG